MCITVWCLETLQKTQRLSFCSLQEEMLSCLPFPNLGHNWAQTVVCTDPEGAQLRDVHFHLMRVFVLRW